MLTLKTTNSILGLVGDPHLGKKFITGVSLDKRGVREALQLTQFKQELMNTSYHMIIVVGDLFDKFIIDYETLYSTYLILAEANTTGVPIVILQGNHDVSRNVDQKSSLNILQAMSSHLENISIITEIEFRTTRGGETIMFIPYSEFYRSADLVSEELEFSTLKPTIAVGHWDIESFGGSDNNLIPLKELAGTCNYIISGHIHTKEEFKVDRQGERHPDGEVSVIVTGSMQPYSHSEDPDGSIYVSMTLEEFDKAITIDKDAFKNKAVRLLLKNNEEPPVEYNCLQLTFKRVDESNKEVVEAKMEVFSFKDLFINALKENNVDDDTINELWDNYLEVSSNAKED